jgi:hypothetical protein
MSVVNKPRTALSAERIRNAFSLFFLKQNYRPEGPVILNGIFTNSNIPVISRTSKFYVLLFLSVRPKSCLLSPQSIPIQTLLTLALDVSQPMDKRGYEVKTTDELQKEETSEDCDADCDGHRTIRLGGKERLSLGRVASFPAINRIGDLQNTK